MTKAERIHNNYLSALSYAKDHNGEFLSTEEECINTKTKLRWKCDKGHEWELSLNNAISAESWCPSCARNVEENKGEVLFRNLIEEVSGKEFPKSRPLWLCGEKGYLELDGYCEELKIAFEFNRMCRHGKKVQRKSELTIIQQNDKIKKETCLRMGILLLYPHKIKVSLWRQYVMWALEEQRRRTTE